MSSHIILPALDPTPGIPATLSRPILTGLLRDELKFNGLIFTDSMTMDAISKMFCARQGRGDGREGRRGLRPALAGRRRGVQGHQGGRGRRGRSARRRSTRRSSGSCGRRRGSGCTLNRQIDIAAIADEVRQRARTRRSRRRSTTVGSRSSRTSGTRCRLAGPRDANVLYLSVLDYASGWREGVPSRTMIPELKKRWPNLTTIEVTDRTTRVGVRAHPRARAARRCRHRGRVRAHRVLQRPDGPEPAADRAARLGGGAEQAVRDRLLRQPLHVDVPAEAAGGAAWATSSPTSPSARPRRRWPARSRSAASCRSRCRACSRSATG